MTQPKAPAAPPKATVLGRLGAFSYRRRRIVLGAWVLFLFGALGLAAVAGGDYRTQFELPGSESQEAIDILESSGFADRTGAQGQVVFQADQGVTDPEVREAMESFFARIEAEVPNITLVSPYEPGGERQVAPDGRIAYAEINFEDRSQEEYVSAGDHVKEIAKEISVTGLTVELGGDMFAEWSEPSSEVIGLIGAAVILLIAFGSLLAMGLPIVAALFGIGTGYALIRLATNWLEMPDFTTPVAVMIGIGVGIDYALFIVTRYRNALHEGMEPAEAVPLAINTAGRAVLFAGCTVVISLLGMLFMGLDMMRGLGLGASLAVLMTMIASVTLVPAILGFVGRNIDRFGLPHRRQAEARGESFWHRWSYFLQRHPWPSAIFGVLLLVILAAPVFAMRLGFSDAGNRPEEDTSRRAYDLLSEGFGPGFNGPMLAAATLPDGEADIEVMNRLSEQLNQTPGVAFASPPILNEDGSAAIIQVIPASSPQDKETADLVHELRDNVIPATVGNELDIKVGGVTAGATDFAEFTFDRLPIFFGAVLALSFILLMVVFRSILVPVKAIIMNLLSISAAYGVLVAIFQWGWGLELLGVGKEGPVEAWIPMMLFAIVFGLSMDYEVFLLSRIREEYDRSGNNGTAVADGLSATARVISAAAAIMVFVFGSFVLGDDRALKMAGLGLAVAVAVDATVIRLILVPATMELLGRANWWFPRWLDRSLPRVHVEAPPVAAPAQTGSEPSAAQ